MEEYRSLKTQNAELRSKLNHTEESLIQAHIQLSELRKKNDQLVIAQQIGGPGEGKAEAKKQIDKLVREIDQCLALLND